MFVPVIFDASVLKQENISGNRSWTDMQAGSSCPLTRLSVSCVPQVRGESSQKDGRIVGCCAKRRISCIAYMLAMLVVHIGSCPLRGQRKHVNDHVGDALSPVHIASFSFLAAVLRALHFGIDGCASAYCNACFR